MPGLESQKRIPHSRQSTALFGLKAAIPSKVSWSSRWDNLTVRLALKQLDLRFNFTVRGEAGVRVCKSAKRIRSLVFESRQKRAQPW